MHEGVLCGWCEQLQCDVFLIGECRLHVMAEAKGHSHLFVHKGAVGLARRLHAPSLPVNNSKASSLSHEILKDRPE